MFAPKVPPKVPHIISSKVKSCELLDWLTQAERGDPVYAGVTKEELLPRVRTQEKYSRSKG